MDPRALRIHMTRDHQRDLEAHGLDARRVSIARYCPVCRRSIPIEDERNAARDWAAHVERHRRREEAPQERDAAVRAER